MLNGKPSEQFITLKQQALRDFQRRALVVNGNDCNINAWLEYMLEYLEPLNGIVLNGLYKLKFSDDVTSAQKLSTLSIKQGKSTLGTESDLIISVLDEGFDANGFTAAAGTLKAGGMLVLINRLNLQSPLLSQRWLSEAICDFPTISVDENRQDFNSKTNDSSKLSNHVARQSSLLEEQQQAIEACIHVVEGHRKRPLVLTADRGRGKTSALGFAVAELIKERAMNVVITAPSLRSVYPFFKHLRESLDIAVTKGIVEYGNSSVRFIAPDELLDALPNCDLLLVDEASALPLPFLKSLVDNYHRAIFSSTIHGYEGCGRGFAIKFMEWLQVERPSHKRLHLSQPIRWAKNDPVEQWLFDTFLLNADIESSKLIDDGDINIEAIPASRLVSDTQTYSQIVALLVNAHYQTSPNDLLQILDNSNLQVLVANNSNRCIGVALTVLEGGLTSEQVNDIQTGKRRPKGQLFPAYIANHLGIDEAGLDHCMRIMRIAVHPEHQKQGIGTALIDALYHQAISSKFYLSTSFGLTDDVLRFWISNGFSPLSLGLKRDAASGCFSLFMAKGANSNQVTWINRASQVAFNQFNQLLPINFQKLGNEELRSLFACYPNGNDNLTVEQIATYRFHIQMVEKFSVGGSSFLSCFLSLRMLIVIALQHQPAIEYSLLIESVLKQRSTDELVKSFDFSGKAELDTNIKQVAQRLVSDLQCKLFG